MVHRLLGAALSVVLTPAGPGRRMAGYVARTGLAEHTLSDLTANLVWLGDEQDTGVVWVSIDSLIMTSDLARRISSVLAATLGVRTDQIVITATHTHSAPEGWTGSLHPAMPGAVEEDLVEELLDRIGTAAADLPAQREPVGLQWTIADGSDIGTNRTDPHGPHDTSAGVLQVLTDDGATLALVIDHACQPSVLPPSSLGYSADWPGGLRRVLGAAMSELGGRQPVVVFLQGAAGESSTRYIRRNTDELEARRIGATMAAAVLRAVVVDAVPIAGKVPSILRASLPVKLRTLPSAEEAMLVRRRARLDWQEISRTTPAVDPVARVARTRYEGAQVLYEMTRRPMPEVFEAPISVVTFDDHAWVHLPAAPFTGVARRIVDASPYPWTRVVGYTDGHVGYLADPLAAPDQAPGYERLVSLLDDEGTDQLVERCARLLREAHKDSGTPRPASAAPAVDPSP